MTAPLVTIFTPTYNVGNYILDTIRSVLNQTYEDFEYIIVDDNSTDATVALIKSIEDPRIRLIQNTSNQGISYNRNLAITEARGKYIAMIDGDDLAHPERIETQVEFLEKNPQYGLLGTGISYIDKEGNKLPDVITYDIPDDEIPARMLFSNYIATSSTLIRKEAIQNILFDSSYVVAEDYDVWLKIIRLWKIGQIRKPFTYYRIHDSSISIQRSTLMEECEHKILKRQLQELQCELSSEEYQLVFDLGKNNQEPYFERFEIVNRTFGKIFNANKKSKIYNYDSLQSLLFRFWYIFYLNISSYNIQTYENAKESGMYALLSKKEKLLFYLKCFLKKQR